MEKLVDLMYPMRVNDTDLDIWFPDKVDVAEAQLAGNFFSRALHAATQPFRSAANVAIHAAEVPLQVTERALMAPGRLTQRLANKLLPGGGGGGGAPAAPAPDSGPQIPDDGSATMDPGDGGGDDSMTSGHFCFGHHQHHHLHPFHPARMQGWEAPDWLKRLNPFSKPAGELLVSAVPGGVAAKDAHAIASKALKNGTLKPEHLKKAGDLARAARSGHKGSVKKIAQIKHLAGKGDPHAEVAMDRLRLADSIQRGGRVEQSTTSIRHLRQVGLQGLNG